MTSGKGNGLSWFLASGGPKPAAAETPFFSQFFNQDQDQEIVSPASPASPSKPESEAKPFDFSQFFNQDQDQEIVSPTKPRKEGKNSFDFSEIFNHDKEPENVEESQPTISATTDESSFSQWISSFLNQEESNGRIDTEAAHQNDLSSMLVQDRDEEDEVSWFAPLPPKNTIKKSTSIESQIRELVQKYRKTDDEKEKIVSFLMHKLDPKETGLDLGVTVVVHQKRPPSRSSDSILAGHSEEEDDGFLATPPPNTPPPNSDKEFEESKVLLAKKIKAFQKAILGSLLD